MPAPVRPSTQIAPQHRITWVPRQPRRGPALVTETAMMSIPPLHRAMTVLATTVAGLPVTDTAGAPLAESDDAQARVMARPSPDDSWRQWADRAMWSMMIHGAAVVVATDVARDGTITALDVVHPDQVSVLSPTLHDPRQRDIRIGDQLLRDGDWLMIRETSLPGWLWPPSRLKLMAAALSIMLSEQAHVEAIYASGAQPTGLFAARSPLDPDRAHDLADELAAAVGGRGDGIIVLPAEVEWISPQLSHADLQLLEARQWSSAQAASMMGVPAHLVGAATFDSETYASARMDLQVFELLTLARYRAALEDALAEWGIGIRLGAAGLTDPTEAERITSLAAAIAAGICSPAQAAARLGWDPPDTGAGGEEDSGEDSDD